MVVHRNDESEFIDLTARAERVLLVDVDGNPVGSSAGTLLSDVINFDTAAATVRSIDGELLIAAGKFSDAYIVNKFGRNPAVAAGTTPEDIWGVGGVYTGFPTGAAEAVRATSTSAADTAAGTGARTIRIEGLSGAGALQSETLTLNGLTPVVSVNTYSRVFRLYALTAGSGGVNAGDITVQHNVTTANIFGRILTGFGQSKAAVYTIPAGHTGYLRRYASSILGVGGTSRKAELAIWTRESGGAVRLRYPFTVSDTVGAELDLHGGIPFPALTDIAFRVTNASADVDVTAAFDLIVIAN